MLGLLIDCGAETKRGRMTMAAHIPANFRRVITAAAIHHHGGVYGDR